MMRPMLTVACVTRRILEIMCLGLARIIYVRCRYSWNHAYLPEQPEPCIYSQNIQNHVYIPEQPEPCRYSQNIQNHVHTAFWAAGNSLKIRSFTVHIYICIYIYMLYIYTVLANPTNAPHHSMIYYLAIPYSHMVRVCFVFLLGFSYR